MFRTLRCEPWFMPICLRVIPLEDFAIFSPPWDRSPGKDRSKKFTIRGENFSSNGDSLGSFLKESLEVKKNRQDQGKMGFIFSGTHVLPLTIYLLSFFPGGIFFFFFQSSPNLSSFALSFLPPEQKKKMFSLLFKTFPAVHKNPQVMRKLYCSSFAQLFTLFFYSLDPGKVSSFFPGEGSKFLLLMISSQCFLPFSPSGFSGFIFSLHQLQRLDPLEYPRRPFQRLFFLCSLLYLPFWISFLRFFSQL